MDKALKLLIAGACVVIMGAGGAYVWHAKSARDAARQAEEAQWCDKAASNLRDYKSGLTPKNAESEAVTEAVVSNCRKDGYLP